MPTNGPTYTGPLPRTDESIERLINAVSIWVNSLQVGMLRVTQFDSSGVAIGSIPTTSAVTSVNDSATSQTLLSSSATRRGLRIFNNSTEILYIKYGTTASVTDFTCRLTPFGLLTEDNYSGRVDGIWANDASGAALITSLS